MKSKIDRMDIAINNVLEAIKYYLKDLEEKYKLQKITKVEFVKTTKDFKTIMKSLIDLKKSMVFKSPNLTEIRIINLSIMHLFEDGEYNTIFTELIHANSALCKDEKDKDNESLSELKKAFKRLSNFYKFRLTAAEYEEDKGLSYNVKVDNIKFILGYYLNVKYSFKKLKYSPQDIDDKYQKCIIGCSKIIKSSADEDMKTYYSNIRKSLTEFATSDLIVKNLERVIELCDGASYDGIKRETKLLINKYSELREKSKESYYKIIGENELVQFDLDLEDDAKTLKKSLSI